jgi:hypothetical protein
MLVAVAFVPSAPMLLEGLGGGPQDLRAACQQAISALDAVERIVVVGAAGQDGWLSGTVDATPYGAPGRPADQALPLAHAVGVTLLGERRHELLGVNGEARGWSSSAAPVGFLVVGDGSARRTEKAPGHLDPRAESFDAHVESALQAGDVEALLALEAELADQLLVGGRTAWVLAADAARQQVRADGTAPHGWTGEVHYAAAPYGVGYLVGSWTPRRR